MTEVIKVTRAQLMGRLAGLAEVLKQCEAETEWCDAHYRAWQEFHDVLWLLGYSEIDYITEE